MPNKITLNLDFINNTRSNININDDIFRAHAVKLLKKYHLTGNFYVNLTLIGKTKIKSLNNEFLHKNYPTDVLSFPILRKTELSKSKNHEIPILLGEIVVCYEVAKKQALDKKLSTDDEIYFYFFMV
jgi:probable rRNA maturation factor